MKKTKVISCLLAAALIAASFAGCGDSKAAAAADDSSKKQEQGQKQDQRGNIAKVVSLEGNRLTVVLADMPDNGGNPEGEKPGGGQPGDSQQPGTPPDGQSGATPEGSSGSAVSGQQRQPGQGGPEIKFSGEEVTYTLSDDVTITKGQGDQAAEIDLSELMKGSVIRFTTTADSSGDEAIDSITVME